MEKEKKDVQGKNGNKENAEGIRINKWISDAGICSRREADRLIETGKVTVDGVRAVTGTRVLKGQKVQVDGQQAVKEKQVILLAVNKPVGVVCTTERKWGDKTLEEMVNYPKRVFSVGRLDKDSEGLILMTNQGDILNKIMKAGNYHEKEYVVTVDKKVTPDFIRRMAKGVPLKELNTVTRPCKVEMAGENRFRIVLTQGLNRQIRRMCEYFGYHVVRLVRVRIMNIELGKIPSGQYRHLTKTEVAALMNSLKKSENNTEFRHAKKEEMSEKRTDKVEKSGHFKGTGKMEKSGYSRGTGKMEKSGYSKETDKTRTSGYSRGTGKTEKSEYSQRTGKVSGKQPANRRTGR